MNAPKSPLRLKTLTTPHKEVSTLEETKLPHKYNPDLIGYAKDLRKNMTKEERHLWYDFLRNYPVKFQRQKVVGYYILDFYCAKANLAVELDGSQHYDPGFQEKDNKRTEFLAEYGISVIRIPNNAVNQNFQGVCEHIDHHVRTRMETTNFA